MQYQNKENASAARAVIRGTYTVLGILAVISFLGESEALNLLKWPILALFIFVFVISHIGGMCEVSIQADDTFVELRNAPILSSKGHPSTYSIDSNRMISYKYTSILFLSYLTVDYIGHMGYKKTAHVGLTLVDKRQKKDLLHTLKRIDATNKERATAAHDDHVEVRVNSPEIIRATN